MKLAVYRYRNDRNSEAQLVLSEEEREELCVRLEICRLDRLKAWVTFSGFLAVKRAPYRRGVGFIEEGGEHILKFNENAYSLQRLPETGRLHEVEFEYYGPDREQVLLVLPPLSEADALPIKGRAPCT